MGRGYLIKEALPSAPDIERPTAPSALTTLLLRFMTDAGPRTIVAAGVPLGAASDIAREMSRAGHFAEYVEESPKLSITDRVANSNREWAEDQGGFKAPAICQTPGSKSSNPAPASRVHPQRAKPLR